MISNKSVITSLLTIALTFPTVVSQACEDVAGWTDKDGFGCTWYDQITGTDDAYYYEFEKGQPRCDVFGGCCYNGGHTAATACCICGGGTSFSQCTDVTIGGLPWTDADGDGCGFYDDIFVGDDPYYYDENDTLCSYYGFDFENNGYTAATACCICGGGSRDSTPATPAPVQPATPAPVVPVTPAPVAAQPLTPAPVAAVTPAPVAGTTPAPVAGTTPAPVAAVTPAPVTAATPAPTVPTTPRTDEPTKAPVPSPPSGSMRYLQANEKINNTNPEEFIMPNQLEGQQDRLMRRLKKH